MRKLLISLITSSLFLVGCTKSIDCSVYKKGIESKIGELKQVSDIFYSNKLNTCIYEEYLDYLTTPDACGGKEYGISVSLIDLQGNTVGTKDGCPNPNVRIKDIEGQMWNSKNNIKPYLGIGDWKKYSDIRQYVDDYDSYDKLYEELKK